MLSRDEMLTELSTGLCRVVFTKVNGEVRDMTCTRQLSYVPIDQIPKGDPNKIPNEKVMPVFDINKLAWRSFVVDNVTTFEKVL